MSLVDPDDEIPRSSIVFLLIVFFVCGFIVQFIAIIFGAYQAIYSPIIDWMLGDFPREGENTVINLGFLLITGSVVFSIFALLSILITRKLRWL